MCPALRDFDLIIDNTVNQPVGVINTSAPITLPLMFQRFWFADAGKGIPVNVFQKLKFSCPVPASTDNPPMLYQPIL